MKIRKILVIFLVLVLLIPFTVWAQEQTQTTQKNPIEKIIELIVENNPTLQSQRDLIKEIPIFRTLWFGLLLVSSNYFKIALTKG